MATEATQNLADELFSKMEERLSTIAGYVKESSDEKEKTKREKDKDPLAGTVTFQEVSNVAALSGSIEEKTTSQFSLLTDFVQPKLQNVQEKMGAVKSKVTDFIPNSIQSLHEHVTSKTQQAIQTTKKESMETKHQLAFSLDTFGSFVNNISSKLQPLAMMTGIPELMVLPEAVNTAISVISNVKETLQNWIMNFPEKIGELKDKIVGVATGMGHFLKSILLFPLTAVQFMIGSIIVPTLTAIFGTVMGLMAPVIGALGLYLVPLLGILTLVIWIFWDEIIWAIKKIWAWVQTITWEDVKKTLYKIKDLVVDVFNWVKLLFTDPAAAMKKLWNGWVYFVNELLIPKVSSELALFGQMFWNRAIKPLGEYLWNSLIMPLYNNYILPIIQPIWNAISPFLKWVWKKLKPVASWIWERLKPVILKIWGKIRSFFPVLSNMLTNLKLNIFSEIAQFVGKERLASELKGDVRMRNYIMDAFQKGNVAKIKALRAMTTSQDVHDFATEKVFQLLKKREASKLQAEKEPQPEIAPIQGHSFSPIEKRTIETKNALDGLQNEMAKMREENRKREKERKKEQKGGQQKRHALEDVTQSRQDSEQYKNEQISNGTLEVR